MPTDSSKFDPLTSGLEKQISHIKRIAGGFSRPTRFSFEFRRIPDWYNQRLGRSCQSASIPGRGLQTQPLKIYGPPREYAYEANYQNEIQLTFRVSVDMFERDFFERWMNRVYSPTTADLEYPDRYRTDLKIYQLDTSDKKTYCTELYDVFPKSMSDIELGTDLSDQIETINITLAYSEYQVIGKLVQSNETQFLLARDERPYFLDTQDANLPFYLQSDIVPQVGPPNPAGFILGGNAVPFLVGAPSNPAPFSVVP